MSRDTLFFCQWLFDIPYLSLWFVVNCNVHKLQSNNDCFIQLFCLPYLLQGVSSRFSSLYPSPWVIAQWRKLVDIITEQPIQDEVNNTDQMCPARVVTSLPALARSRRSDSSRLSQERNLICIRGTINVTKKNQLFIFFFKKSWSINIAYVLK